LFVDNHTFVEYHIPITQVY